MVCNTESAKDAQVLCPAIYRDRLYRYFHVQHDIHLVQFRADLLGRKTPPPWLLLLFAAIQTTFGASAVKRACADVGGQVVAEWAKSLHLTQRSQVQSPLKAEKIGEKNCMRHCDKITSITKQCVNIR